MVGLAVCGLMLLARAAPAPKVDTLEAAVANAHTAEPSYYVIQDRVSGEVPDAVKRAPLRPLKLSFGRGGRLMATAARSTGHPGDHDGQRVLVSSDPRDGRHLFVVRLLSRSRAIAEIARHVTRESGRPTVRPLHEYLYRNPNKVEFRVRNSLTLGSGGNDLYLVPAGPTPNGITVADLGGEPFPRRADHRMLIGSTILDDAPQTPGPDPLKRAGILSNEVSNLGLTGIYVQEHDAARAFRILDKDSAERGYRIWLWW